MMSRVTADAPSQPVITDRSGLLLFGRLLAILGEEGLHIHPGGWSQTEPHGRFTVVFWEHWQVPALLICQPGELALYMPAARRTLKQYRTTAQLCQDLQVPVLDADGPVVLRGGG